jgi:hypothetical protein
VKPAVHERLSGPDYGGAGRRVSGGSVLRGQGPVACSPHLVRVLSTVGTAMRARSRISVSIVLGSMPAA